MPYSLSVLPVTQLFTQLNYGNATYAVELYEVVRRTGSALVGLDQRS